MVAITAINFYPKSVLRADPARFFAGLCSPSPIGLKTMDRDPRACGSPPAKSGGERPPPSMFAQDPPLDLGAKTDRLSW
jgi:hypothetical protein